MLIEENLSHDIIGACIEVHKSLGRGFSEVLYKDALEIEFRNRNIHFEREKRYDVYYKEIKLSHFYFADFVINDKVILEIKCTSKNLDDHYNQCINYLKVSGNSLALLVNFNAAKIEIKRIVC